MNTKRNLSKGFTLVEVLIVLIILAVLAAVAFPVYSAQTRRAYRAEALNEMTAIRSAMSNFLSMNNTYVGAAFGTPLGAAAIGLNAPTAALNGGQTPHFTYVFSGLAAATYTVTATPTAAAIPPLAATDTVIFNQGGEGASVLT